MFERDVDFFMSFPQEGVQSGECQLVPRVDEAGRAHFETVESASVVCDICKGLFRGTVSS